MRFVETLGGRLIPVSRVTEAKHYRVSRPAGSIRASMDRVQVLLDDGEEVQVSVPDWNAATRRGPEIIPAAPGTTILIEKSEWVEGDDGFYELPCLGWRLSTNSMWPICMTHGTVWNLLAGVKHPCGRVETPDGEVFADLDAFRAVMRGEVLPDAGKAQGDPANPASVSA